MGPTGPSVLVEASESPTDRIKKKAPMLVPRLVAYMSTVRDLRNMEIASFPAYFNIRWFYRLLNRMQHVMLELLLLWFS